MPDLHDSALQDSALLARSVLSCPHAMTLLVDEQPLEDDRYDVTCDVHGAPVFSAAEGSLLLAAALAGDTASLEVVSGFRTTHAPGHPVRLDLHGRLLQRDVGCACCGDPRSLVELAVDRVSLRLGAHVVGVDVSRFRDRRHTLNPGYLQRTREHANDAHGLELRSMVVSAFGIPLRSLMAASLVDLDARGVEVSWLDWSGAHTRRVDFARPVTSPEELGEALRAHLHSGIC